MRKPKIITTNNGFAIVTTKGTDAVAYHEVSAIVAYRLDELTTDLVYCDIVTGSGDVDEIRAIHKELLGFGDGVKSLETLPGFDRRWRDARVLPPFATNRTVISDHAVRARPILKRARCPSRRYGALGRRLISSQPQSH